MNRLIKGAWVVVADEDKALFLKNGGDAAVPVFEVVERLETADLLAVEDRSGRRKDHQQRETVEPPDYHRMAGATLAQAVASQLLKSHQAGAFTRLVLVAPPQVLGALRAALDGALDAVTVAELAKTLTKHPLPKMAEIIRDDLAAL
jgi:protein required for attachment to host cells